MLLCARALASLRALGGSTRTTNVQILRGGTVVGAGPFRALVSHRVRKPVEQPVGSQMSSETEWFFKFDAFAFRAAHVQLLTTDSLQEIGGPQYTVNAVDEGRTDPLQIIVSATKRS